MKRKFKVSCDDWVMAIILFLVLFSIGWFIGGIIK